MNIVIKRVSTLEPNVSLRDIKFNVLADGKFITQFDDFEEAEEFKEAVECGDILLKSI